MTLTETFIPYNRQSAYDAQIAALDWEREPVEFGMNQYPVFQDMFSILGSMIMRNRITENTFINSGTFICYDPTDLNRRVGPDFYVAFDVDERSIRNRMTYLPWEVGKPPDFVLEVASPTTAANDLGRKRDIYAQIGVTEYWRFDPTGGDLYGEALAGETLLGGVYHRLATTVEPDGNPKGHSPVLGLTLAWVDGGFRVYDEATGRYMSTYRELETELGDSQTRVRQLEAELARLRTLSNGDPQ